MDEPVRLPNGRYAPGSSGGRGGGRKRKVHAPSVDEILMQEFSKKVPTRDGKTLSKTRATARQIANEGATGKQARLAMASLRIAEERSRSSAPAEPTLSDSDQAIFATFLSMVRQTLAQENSDAKQDESHGQPS